MTTMQAAITWAVFLLMLSAIMKPILSPAKSRTRSSKEVELLKSNTMQREAVVDVPTTTKVASVPPQQAWFNADAVGWLDPEPSEYVPATWVDTLRISEGFAIHRGKSDSKNCIGYVLMRGYKDRVERSLVLTKPLLAKKHGTRTALPPADGFYTIGSPIVRDSTLAAVKELLDGGVLLQKPKRTEPKPAIAQVKEEAPAAADEPVKEKEPKSKPLTTWRGRLKEYGIGERSLSNYGKEDGEDDEQNDAPKTVQQYRLVLEMDNGELESVWGQDLHRALKDADAHNGDLIEVLQTGKKKLGGGRKLNLYIIKKVA